jgi:hypothetical protein
MAAYSFESDDLNISRNAGVFPTLQVLCKATLQLSQDSKGNVLDNTALLRRHRTDPSSLAAAAWVIARARNWVVSTDSPSDFSYPRR